MIGELIFLAGMSMMNSHNKGKSKNHNCSRSSSGQSVKKINYPNKDKYDKQQNDARKAWGEVIWDASKK